MNAPLNLVDGSFKRALLYVSVAHPIQIFLTMAHHAWRHDFSGASIVGGIALTLASVVMGRFLYRRSKGMEAAFFSTRVSPEAPELANRTLDGAILVAAVGLSAFTLFRVYLQ